MVHHPDFMPFLHIYLIQLFAAYRPQQIIMRNSYFSLSFSEGVRYNEAVI